MTVPDVTVSLAVYNTMPYLRETLDSLVKQSIGHDRLEVVAVDDGSNDGSGALLDEYAEHYPSVFRVLHQENSGGPAGPCNVALDRAEGRFVYFLGADDYLAPKALERMVGYADEHEADIVMGRVVGVNGRFIRQGVFRRNDPDLDRYGPELRWSLANTNLYRRSLVERLGLRYVEGLPFGSDQPFMLEAVVNAKRIAVLGDYTCYYAVDRHERTNISYSTPYADRLRCIETLVSAVARLVPEGAPRDTILVRHFTWEVPSLLRQGHRELPRAFEDVVEDVASFVERYGNESIFAQLRVVPKVLLQLALKRDVVALRQMLSEEAPEHPALIVGRDGVYVDYPRFSYADPDPAYRLPDEVGFRDRLAAALRTVRTTWRGLGPARTLEVVVQTNLVDPDGRVAISAIVRRADETFAVEASVAPGDDGSVMVLRVPAAELAGPPAAPGQGAWKLLLIASAGDQRVEVPVPVPAEGLTRTRFLHRGGVASVWPDDSADMLALQSGRVPAREVPRAVVRRLSSRRR